MTQENNKKWSPLLVGTLWFLWGTLVLASALWIWDVRSKLNPFAFVTQQFVSTTHFNLNPTNQVNTVNPQVAPNPNPNSVNTVVNLPVAPNPNPNPVNPRLFGRWNYLFQTITSNPNPPASPICKVKWVVTTSVQPGVIHFEAQLDPADARIRCGLIDTSTNLLVDLAPVNALSFDFFNIVSSDYKVVCLVRESGVIGINSFNRCADGTFTIGNTPANPPIGTSPIDLELYGEYQNPFANGWIATVPAVHKYGFKIYNAIWLTGWTSSGVVLRVKAENMNNIVATGSTLSWSWYEWTVGNIPPLQSTGLFEIAWTDLWAINGSGPVLMPKVFAELCNYSNDADSQPCNSVFTGVLQDDEQIW